jgi:isoamylase
LELLLFDREEDEQPARMIRLDSAVNRPSHYWHVFVEGVKPGQLYDYRVQGPFDPASGMEGDNCAAAMKSVVVDLGAYIWEGDAPLQRPASKTSIYEMHVRSFTRQPLAKNIRSSLANVHEASGHHSDPQTAIMIAEQLSDLELPDLGW